MQQVHEPGRCQEQAELGCLQHKAHADDAEYRDHGDGPRRVETQVRQRYTWPSWQANISIAKFGLACPLPACPFPRDSQPWCGTATAPDNSGLQAAGILRGFDSRRLHHRRESGPRSANGFPGVWFQAGHPKGA
jgi:hypothetical protein